MSPITTSFAAVFARHARDRLDRQQPRTLMSPSNEQEESEDRGDSAGQPKDEDRDGSREGESSDD